jgi:NADH-quinone oxidoreductase subunit H
MSWAMFQMAEYASIWLISILATVMFFGGWMSPIDSALFNWVPGWIWLGLKDVHCNDGVHLGAGDLPTVSI